jgi:hypothetical protein
MLDHSREDAAASLRSVSPGKCSVPHRAALLGVGFVAMLFLREIPLRTRHEADG